MTDPRAPVFGILGDPTTYGNVSPDGNTAFITFADGHLLRTTPTWAGEHWPAISAGLARSQQMASDPADEVIERVAALIDPSAFDGETIMSDDQRNERQNDAADKAGEIVVLLANAHVDTERAEVEKRRADANWTEADRLRAILDQRGVKYDDC